MNTITEKDFERAAEAAPAPRIVKFTNFSSEDFTHTWNKVPYTFKAGASMYMQASLADHFAKHLVNRELLRRGRENDTSPKKPGENPFYMELYSQCISAVDTGNGPTDETKLEQEAIDRNMKEKFGEAEPEAEEKKEPEAAAAPARGKGKGRNAAPKAEEKKEEGEFEDLTPPDADEEDEDE